MDMYKSFEQSVKTDKIDSMYSRMLSKHEFEFMFYNYKPGVNDMRLNKFLDMLNFVNYKSKLINVPIERTNTLDISYKNPKTKETFRITVEGVESINKYMELFHNRNNHVIFNVLVEMSKDKSDIKLIKKTRSSDNLVDIDDLDIRVRMSEETETSVETLTEESMRHIIFRYKQRVSLPLVNKDGVTIRIDLTTTKMHSNINKVENAPPMYEAELELVSTKNKPDKKYLTMVYNEVTMIVKLLQQSNYIVTKTEENKVVNYYKDLLDIKKKDLITLDSRNTVSLEIQHVVDKLPNRYAVTDKADGTRYFLVVMDRKVYLISHNLHVKFTGIVLPDSKKNYNGTVLDGEYMFLPKYNRYVFMSFDCLYFGGKDTRELISFMERLSYVDKVIDDCFTSPPLKGFKFETYSSDGGSFSVDKIVKFHDKQIDRYATALNHDIKNSLGLLVRRKYFIPVGGGDDTEVFAYSELLWKKFVHDRSTNYPYILDGLIYHPLEQKYTTSVKDSKYMDYKWKPADKNSIDFYITFEKDKRTGNFLTLYDNSGDGTVKDKPYRVAHLHVGKSVKNEEFPVLFKEHEQLYIAHLYLDNGEIRDSEGSVVQDSTVVEFYYKLGDNINDIVSDKEYRWVPLRTRYDKTESVKKYKKSYGNYYSTADRVWRSITNNFTIDDITLLAQKKMYDKHMNSLRKMVDHSVIKSEAKENVWYNKRTELAKPMRNFHNWIKSTIIYTYCFPKKVGSKLKQMSVLDIACGKGGDNMKFYHSKVDFYVGIDVDNTGLTSVGDGAISRYNKQRKTYPKFPQMHFIHADGGTLLEYSEQIKALGSMSEKNKMLMNKFFSPKNRVQFDRINCQFAIHYFLKNETVWSNFLTNVNNHMKPDGYIMFTCFDQEKIVELIGDKDKYTSYYTDKNGSNEVLFELVKKYDKLDSGTGKAIDYYNSIHFQEGVYFTEYLVDKQFMIDSFSKISMELVDTDLFDNQFNMHRDYFEKVVPFEENIDNKKFLSAVSQYYDQSSSINKACYEFTKLNRYYIFKKKSVSQKGGSTFEHPLIDKKKYVIGATETDYTMCESVRNVLADSKIIPQSVDTYGLFNDINYDITPDNVLTDEFINGLCSNLKIEHSVNQKKETVLEGVNIVVVGNDSTKLYSSKGAINKRIPSLVLYNDNGSYRPVYNVKKNGDRNGMFSSRSKFIGNLVKSM